MTFIFLIRGRVGMSLELEERIKFGKNKKKGGQNVECAWRITFRHQTLCIVQQQVCLVWSGVVNPTINAPHADQPDWT